ncbi:MAG: lytic murein transglycosylase [Mesorhizobium sp.]|nr:MAG: lytic murein transglycosylase [Mesorhizobium sp.]
MEVRRPGTPLWPAGHLPLKGGDRTTRMLSPTTNVAEMGTAAKLPISPLEGEMAGRPEGGGTERKHLRP